jgi:hypothetical protein
LVKVVGNKTFVLRQGVWTDTAFDPSQMKTTRVGFGSEDYFRLLAARPELGPVFALGPRVIVVLEGVAYETVEGAGDPLVLPPAATPPPTGLPRGHTATPTPLPTIPTQPQPPANGLPVGILAALGGLGGLSAVVALAVRKRARRV